MTGLLLLGAALAYLAAAAAYFRARFALAAAFGLCFAALAAPAALRALGPAAGAVALALLAVAPGVYLVVHWIDVRRGLFLLPTIYSIPLAFVCALLLWLAAAVAAVL